MPNDASPSEATLSVRGARHRLEFGRLAVEVDADDGGRIVEWSLDGWNAIASKAESPVAYGSSFWPSPQSDWGWPPPPELDRMPWTPAPEPSTLAFTSAMNGALGLVARERVSF